MDGVFSIRLNKEGIAVARVIARVFTVLSISTLILCAVVTVRNVFLYDNYQRMADGMELRYGFWAGIMFHVVPIGLFLMTAINLVTSFFTLRFAMRLGYSLRTMDEDRFSNSFRSLAIAGIIGLFGIIVQMGVYFILLVNQFENKL
jgi:hypothetical protein